MARSPRKFLLRRSKDNLAVVFARRAARVGTHPLGNLQAVENEAAPGRISILNIEESEVRGVDFFEIRNVRFNLWYTRYWNNARDAMGIDKRIMAYGDGAGDVVTKLNNIIGYTTEVGIGDEGGSGLSSVGGTSVVSFRMENVNYALETATDPIDAEGFLLTEDDDNFVSEELNTVIQRSDGTYLSVDTRSVNHGGTGGSAGNPVVSGAVSDDTLTLTLDDATTVDIDVTSLNNGTETTIGLPNWYRTYANPGTGDATAGAQVSTLQESRNANPFYYGVTLKRGREFLFDHATNSNANYLGIWGGSTSYTPSAAGNRGLWDKMLKRINARLDYGTDDYDSKGFDLTSDYDLVQGTTKLVLQYDYDTNKLKLWDVTYDIWYLITTASVAEDGNPIVISSALPTDGVLATLTDREQTWNLIADRDETETTWRNGFNVDTVWQHNVGLHPGEKMITTTPVAWLGHYIGFTYTGTSTGQTNAENELQAAITCGNNERLYEKAGFTINTSATRYDTSNYTAAMGTGKFSIRYHLDNSCDIFDEDNEEVLFTKNVDFDGSTQFLQMAFSSTVNTISYLVHIWTLEPFGATWFYNPNNRDKTVKANKRHVGTDGPGTRIQWGEKMYPGQELIFQENQGGSGNTYIGVRNADDSDWVRWIAFDGTKVDETAGGFDIATRYSSGYAINNKWVALRYDYGDNKLKLYDIHTTGVETLITEATVACDGNAIRINASGNNYVPGASTVLRYYGWEYIHRTTPAAQYWQNWRINRPAANDYILIDTVLRYRQALIPGRYFQWTTSSTYVNHFNGKWKSSNAASGLENVESTADFWDWGWKGTNNERIQNLLGWTHNTSNSNYNSFPYWQDPNPGTTIVRLRYKSDNSMDLYDVSNSAVIATKDVNLGGEAFYLDWGVGIGINNLNDLHGGGDLVSGTL